ncbi:hypothetical protein F511_33968 [Dorcoceras hygrometricum]|uniref:Uncharacterized protein n=1 Tax=Dorcoceras hygrometricum TaxID=472368 RepID=A0A2Z7AFI8_9LAMI|nr:hypothetical protein F511_33968 [Dorcoceras hygrometricum]
MQHAIINAMKCMRAIKDRIARPLYQLENHLNQPLYPYGVSTGEIIGTTHQSASHNVAFNQVINQSVNQARDISPGTANLKPSHTGHGNSALIMQHAIINAMKCMRAIKDRIARPVYQLENHLNQPLYPHSVSTGEIIGTTHQSASRNVAFNQVINQSVNQARDISPGMANLKPSNTGHGNSARRALTQKLTLTEERSGKISQKASNEQALIVSSNPWFQSPNWYQSVEKLKRSSAPPISFKTTADTTEINERALRCTVAIEGYEEWR